MEEFETGHTHPLPGANGGEQASADRRFAEIRQAARRNRMNGKRIDSDAQIEGLPAGTLRLCLPLLGRFYLIRVAPAAKEAQAAADAKDTNSRLRIALLAANVASGFMVAVAATVYAIYGDGPFLYMARETGFFLLRQISVIRDLLGGILSFSLF